MVVGFSMFFFPRFFSLSVVSFCFVSLKARPVHFALKITLGVFSADGLASGTLGMTSHPKVMFYWMWNRNLGSGKASNYLLLWSLSFFYWMARASTQG